MLSPIRQKANCHSTESHGIRRNIKKRESLRFRNFFSEAKKPFFRFRNGKKSVCFAKKMFGCHGTRRHLLKKTQDFHLLLRLSVELERAWAQSPGLNFRVQLSENK